MRTSFSSISTHGQASHLGQSDTFFVVIVHLPSVVVSMAAPSQARVRRARRGSGRTSRPCGRRPRRGRGCRRPGRPRNPAAGPARRATAGPRLPGAARHRARDTAADGDTPRASAGVGLRSQVAAASQRVAVEIMVLDAPEVGRVEVLAPDALLYLVGAKRI